MMSSIPAPTTPAPTTALSHPVTIVPHCTLPAPLPSRPLTDAIRCPRCHDLVELPAWVADGALTECCGLLLRVTRAARRWQLEPL